jgi:hypothetical protein
MLFPSLHPIAAGANLRTAGKVIGWGRWDPPSKYSTRHFLLLLHVLGDFGFVGFCGFLGFPTNGME